MVTSKKQNVSFFPNAFRVQIYTNNYDLQAGGTFIGAAGGIGLAVGLLCGIQAAVTLAVGA